MEDQATLNANEEIEGGLLGQPSPWTWEHSGGLGSGEEPPTLEEEARHWCLLIAETSLAIDEAETPSQRAKYRRYLKRATFLYNQAIERLGRLEEVAA